MTNTNTALRREVEAILLNDIKAANPGQRIEIISQYSMFSKAAAEMACEENPFGNIEAATQATNKGIGQDLLGNIVSEGGEPDRDEDRQRDFRNRLAHAINCHCKESGSDTPDFILGDMLAAILDVFDAAMQRRKDWFHRK